MVKFLLVLWFITIVLFFGIIFFSKNRDPYPPVIQTFFLTDFLVGVGAFVLMCFFAVVGVIISPKERKVGLLTGPQNLNKRKLHWVNKLLGVIGISLLILAVFLYGRFIGLERGIQVGKKQNSVVITPPSMPTPTPTSVPPQQPSGPSYRRTAWGGPELWEAVNKRRIENGVGPLNNKAELCTIAAIRLNELLELGKLDGHEGFGNMPTRRPDLKWIFDKYHVYEFLIAGYPTPEEAVNGWEHTMGHKSLLKGGEFVWGCIYAQNTFGVAIAAY